MNIRNPESGMDQEDLNVMHSRNALEYYKMGDMYSAKMEVSLDMGFLGTWEEWVKWAEGIK